MTIQQLEFQPENEQKLGMCTKLSGRYEGSQNVYNVYKMSIFMYLTKHKLQNKAFK